MHDKPKIKFATIVATITVATLLGEVPPEFFFVFLVVTFFVAIGSNQGWNWK